MYLHTSTTSAGGSPLPAVYKTAFMGHVHIVEYLVNKQGEQILHEPDAQLNDPVIFTAALSGNAEMVRYLVSKNCNVHCKNNDGDTPLHWAAQSFFNRADAAAYLVDECGCDPLYPDRFEGSHFTWHVGFGISTLSSTWWRQKSVTRYELTRVIEVPFT